MRLGNLARERLAHEKAGSRAGLQISTALEQHVRLQCRRDAHALLAGATVALVYAAMMELTGITIMAVISGLVLAVSHGFWYF